MLKGMNSHARAVALLAAGSAALALPGCVVAAVAVGAAAAYGAVQYGENEAYRDFRTSLDVTWDATLDSMRTLGYPVGTSVPRGTAEGTIQAGDAKVVVERHPGDFTRVRVRIGTFSTDDNRRRAGLVLEEVARRVE
jgi:hypothetical protein